MNLIIPMAGRGSRLRPHTLTTPKPLVPVAGKPIVQRLVEGLSEGIGESFQEIAFIIGDFGEEVTTKLQEIAGSVGAVARFYYQEEPLGPAHAISCASLSLHGPCIIAFADTLFQADFQFDINGDGAIWVQKVPDPSSYGVVKVDGEGIITEFVEKSPVFVSDMAIVGIYYIRDGSLLRSEIDYIIQNEIRDKGEYQITTVLENLKNKGLRFHTANIDEWLDCGNKDAIINANRRILEMQGESIIEPDVQLENSFVIDPCFIGAGAVIRESIVGPFVSVGRGTRVERSVMENSVIQNESTIRNVTISNSMIGNKAIYRGTPTHINIGDYSRLDQ